MVVIEMSLICKIVCIHKLCLLVRVLITLVFIQQTSYLLQIHINYIENKSEMVYLSNALVEGY